MKPTITASILLACLAGAALAQGGNPEYRMRAKFRTPNDGGWGSDESVGHADFRVRERFISQFYYGPIERVDQYKFIVQIDFRDISGFDAEFAASPYDTDYDTYINGGFVGRVFMGVESAGLAELVYDSRAPQFPELPLPEGFPDPVSEFDLVTVFFADGAEPAIGDPEPSGSPVFASELVEEFARGDVNQDVKVDEDDFPYLADNYDPYHLLGDHVGPVHGDFTGDNLTDLADYDLFAANWTDSHEVPPEPDPIVLPCVADMNGDGTVNTQDVLMFLNAWAAGDPSADINGDGEVNTQDVLAFLNLWAAGC